VSFVGHLDPDESLGEILAGLIMVLTFTLAAGVMSRGGQDGVRTLLFAAVGCNLAWGIIDAAFYLIACLTEHGRHAVLLRGVQQATDAAEKAFASLQAKQRKEEERIHEVVAHFIEGTENPITTGARTAPPSTPAAKPSPTDS